MYSHELLCNVRSSVMMRFRPSSSLASEIAIFFTASASQAVFATDDPGGGAWRRVAALERKYPDPMLFVDDDQRSFYDPGSVQRFLAVC